MTSFTADELSRIIPVDSVLNQLGEESAELAQAALKLRRARTEPSCPISQEQAHENLMEEIADTIACGMVLAGQISIDPQDLKHRAIRKLRRWKHRINNIK